MELLPTTEREQRLWSAGIRSVAGVDEVGRGAAVSAVVAAAVVLPVGFHGLDAVRDSKLLPPPARQRLAAAIRQVASVVALGAASTGEIERLNVRGATALAMQRALRRAATWEHAIVDGPPMRELSADRCTAIIDGDALCLSIACASIVAKVARDDLLRLLAKRHPGYGWEHNAGYLTAEHRAAVRRFGVTPHHRRGFLRSTLATPGEGPAPR